MKRKFLLLSFCVLAAFVSAQHTDLSSYYAAADGKCGANLKTALFNIITSHTNLGYDGLWTAYKTTDKRSDGKLYDIYSNTTNYVIGGSAQGANYSAEGDSYNREHLVPQSVFNEATPMKADAHFVYPADGYINNMRSNYPFGTVGTVTKTSNNGYSKLGSAASGLGYSGTVFEPNDEYKGDIARAILYVVTCYQDKLSDWDTWAMLAKNTYPSLSSWSITLLLQWSAQDPVSQKEIDRNDAVDKLQGNRNPFVDYPGIEQYIWGDLKTTNVDLESLASGTSSAVVRPEISPNGGTFSSSQSVTITCATSGSSIYYTLDGTTPSKSSTLYTGTFVLTSTTTVKAIAYDGDDNASSVATAVFTKSSSGGSVGSLLYESFSGYTSASDGTSAIETSNTNLDYSSWSSFDRLYLGGTNKGYNSTGCGKLGSGSYAGSMTASNLPLVGDGTLTFKVMRYNTTDPGILNVTVTGATATGDVSVTAQAEWTDYTVDLTDGTGDVSITFATTNKRAYIDEIRLEAAGSSATAPDAPVFSPNGGTFTTSQDVTITCPTAGTTIYYTTNGTTPTQSSTQYSGTITLYATTTINAIAFDGDGNASEVSSATFSKTGSGSTETQLLYESFSGYSNADDGSSTLTPSSTVLDYNSWTTLTNIYAGGTTEGYGGGAYGKMGKSGANGSMTASGIALNGAGTLTFMVKKWSSDTGVLNVEVTGATATGDVTVTPTDTWTKYTVNLTDGNGDVSITFATSTKRARIDEIELVAGTSTPEEEVPAVPVFSPASGTYTSAQSVSITCATSGAIIHYTTDGSEPTASSPTYSSPISLSTNGTYTIKAIAVSAGGTKTSSVSSATYTISLATKPNAPRFSLPGGTYTSPQSIQVVADDGCTIKYYWGTVDTATPNVNYVIGNNALSLNSLGTYYLKAVAVKDDIQSDVASATYEYTSSSSSSSDSDVYELVTDASQLVAGKNYIIVASETTKALGTQQNTNNRAAVDITKDAENNTVTATSDTQILVLGGNATSGWSFYTGSGYLYAASSSNNYLRTQTTDNNNSKATITISSGIASITFDKGSYTRNQLKYNSNNTLFSCYSSGQQAVALYRQQESSGSSEPAASDLQTSLYRIKDGTGYLCVGTDGTLSKTTDASDLGTIFTVSGSAGNYKLQAQGLTISTASGTSVVLGEDATVALTHGTNNEYISLGSDTYINADVKANAVGAEWTFEEVETTDANLPTFTLNQPKQNNEPVGSKYYRTFFADFPFTLTEGTANIITVDEGYAVTQAISGTVPANTAVLIISESEEVSVVPQATDLSLTAPEGNQLIGTCQPVSASSLSGQNIYTFQAKNGQVGFYRYNGSTLGANKAYLAVSGGNAPSFAISIGESTTGISSLERSSAAGDGAIYDLSGRRIEKPVKGVYIKDGKKIFVR